MLRSRLLCLLICCPVFALAQVPEQTIEPLPEGDNTQLRQFASGLLPGEPAEPDPQPETDEVRNVILIIGDGMDDQQITIARNYLVGSNGELTLDSMPMRGAVQVQTITDETDGVPVYVADSANTATAISTGIVTSRGRIATSAGDDRDLTTIIEHVKAAGLRAGLVATSSVTDATPASFAAHISLRMCENPDRMDRVEISGIYLGNCQQDKKAAGGPGSIAEQLAVSDVDLILGGGARHFDPRAEGEDVSVRRLAEKNGFTVVTTPEQLASAPLDARVLGLFSPSTMPVLWRGEDGREAEIVKRSVLNRFHTFLGSAELPAVMECEPEPDFKGQPRLAEMTQAALDRLSHNNNRGFFLMVESASIDKKAHERRPCGSIGELKQLNEALRVALDFAELNPRTLILVTADHSQSAQLIPAESLFARYPIPVYTPGHLARIRTPEGQVMAVNYATNNFFMEEHTGANVPLFGNSEANFRVPTFLRQTDLFGIMADYLGLDVR